MRKGKKLFSLIFLTPAFILYTVFVMLPICFSFYAAFTKWNGGGKMKFLGLQNYQELFSDSDFWLIMKNTAVAFGFAIVIQIIFGLILAYIIFKTAIGFKFFRTVVFFPVVIAPVAIGTMFILFYNSEIGPLNKILEMIGMGFLKKEWLSDPKIVLYTVVLPMTWQYIGFYTMLYLTALQSIPEQIFESARIDGANTFQIFIKIVTPLVWEVMQICLILDFTGALKIFDHPWIMTWGGPGASTTFLGVLMFKTAFLNHELGLGSSVAITMLFTALLFTVVLKKFFSTETV